MDRPVSVPRVLVAVESAEGFILCDGALTQLQEAFVEDVEDRNLQLHACESDAKSLHVLVGGQGSLANADVIWTKGSNALRGVLHEVHPYNPPAASR